MHLMTERFGKLKDFQFQGYDYKGEEEPGVMFGGICSAKATSTVSKVIRNVFGMYSLIGKLMAVAMSASGVETR